MLFGTEKLEWLGYLKVKNFEDTFIRFHTVDKCDGQIDRQTCGHRITAKAVLDASIVRQKAVK